MHDRPWATVATARIQGTDSVAWFKACNEAQRFEPRLTADLSRRWPGRVADVLAHDPDRAWLLMADAGTSVASLGNAPEIWLRALPRYAELQRGETSHAEEHVTNGVPDLRLARLPGRYEELLRRTLPLVKEETGTLRRLQGRFVRLCDELAAASPLQSIQHDDLHLWNLFARNDKVRVIDWGDSSVAHPFQSLVVTFRFLEEVNGLAPSDRWFARLRDAYLEPWGTGLVPTFDLAMRVGTVAHAIASVRQRDALSKADVAGFDEDFAAILRRALTDLDR